MIDRLYRNPSCATNNMRYMVYTYRVLLCNRPPCLRRGAFSSPLRSSRFDLSLLLLVVTSVDYHARRGGIRDEMTTGEKADIRISKDELESRKLFIEALVFDDALQDFQISFSGRSGLQSLQAEAPNSRAALWKLSTQ